MATRPFLASLLHDTGANTLAIAAAAVIPMIGVVGGAVDASRLYLTQSKLQQACDAGTLAARKKLSGDKVNGSIPAEIEQTAQNFFSNNFAEGIYGTNSVEYVLAAGDETRMDGSATVNVPMTLMAVFGVDQMPIEVSCSAELNLPNIDVMLVLDMSGSMKGAKIDALKDAVLNFYDKVMAVKPQNARIRIGIVPYNGAVNVGRLLVDEDPNFVADEWVYQSRSPEYWPEGAELDSGSYREPIPQNPNHLSKNPGKYEWDERDSSSDAACNAMDGTYQKGAYTFTVSNDDWDPNYYGGRKGRRGACVANVEWVKKAQGNEFRRYSYEPRTLDTSRFKLFDAVQTDTGSDGSNQTSVWNGCIEERQTVATTDFKPIPDEAYDLDIDMVPTSGDPATQWKAMWPQVTFDRGGPGKSVTTNNKSNRGHNCPVASSRLTEYEGSGGNRDSLFVSRVNALDPGGGTMHDIGMIWAGRMISPDGIFAADNEEAPNGDAITRHIIFMTDGEMGANPSNTTAYGNYSMDGRFMGFPPNGRQWTEDETIPINNARLAAVCERIKNKNVTIWTVSFDVTVNQQFVKGCATGQGRAFDAADAGELSKAFEAIAGSIAELRLVR